MDKSEQQFIRNNKFEIKKGKILRNVSERFFDGDFLEVFLANTIDKGIEWAESTIIPHIIQRFGQQKIEYEGEEISPKTLAERFINKELKDGYRLFTVTFNQDALLRLVDKRIAEINIKQEYLESGDEEKLIGELLNLVNQATAEIVQVHGSQEAVLELQEQIESQIELHQKGPEVTVINLVKYMELTFEKNREIIETNHSVKVAEDNGLKSEWAFAKKRPKGQLNETKAFKAAMDLINSGIVKQDDNLNTYNASKVGRYVPILRKALYDLDVIDYDDSEFLRELESIREEN